MITANQLTFTTCEAFLKLRAHGPAKLICGSVDWPFIHVLVIDRPVSMAEYYHKKEAVSIDILDQHAQTNWALCLWRTDTMANEVQNLRAYHVY